MKPAPIHDRSRWETLAVIGVAILGAIGRIWPPGRLGLTHFDEGIYAFAGTWAFAPVGIRAIDPMLIPYAPPGFPILVGLAYRWLGVSDQSAIAVSVIAGSLSILVVGWLARRTFGPGAGLAASAVAAFSGPHLAFSRMALTDVSFLLVWMITLGLGIRFLEKPGPLRAILMGLAVGLAQQFKYNGWMAGGIILMAALAGVLIDRENRRLVALARVLGWGLLGVVVAWLVVWPWYLFVERHGGYSDLLRHQRSYLGGIDQWWPHLQTQSDQAVGLSGGIFLMGATLGLACLGRLFRAGMENVGISVGRRVSRLLVAALAFVCFLDAPVWMGLSLVPWLLTSREPGTRVLGCWWLALGVMTPFYHPYARLWLPFHAVNWLLLGGLIARVGSLFDATWWRVRLWEDRSIPVMALVPGFSLGLILQVWTVSHSVGQPDLLEASDSVRRASSRVASIVGGEPGIVQTWVRPSVSFYMAGRVNSARMAGPDPVVFNGRARGWLLVDSAILRSERGQPGEQPAEVLLDRYRDAWEVVEEFPTTLSLPTLLDLDPGSVRTGTASRSAPLWLLRPRGPR